MDKYTHLYIDLDKSPKNALVYSGSSTTTTFPAIIFGDTLKLIIQFQHSGIKDTSINGNASYTLKSAIGEAGGYEYCNSSNFVPSASYGWSGSMVTNTVQLSQSMSTTEDYTTFLFELEAINGSTGERTTPLQVPVTVYREVLSSSPTALDTSSFFTNDQVLALISSSMISASYARTSSVATREGAGWITDGTTTSTTQKVGIGVSDPFGVYGADFMVRDPTGNAVFRLDAPNGLTQFYLGSSDGYGYPQPIYFDFIHGNTAAGRLFVQDNIFSLYTKKNNSGYFTILTTSQSADVERLRITNRGWIGINTTNPGAQLHVQGNISASNFLGTASYAINGGSSVANQISCSYASGSTSSSYAYLSSFAISASHATYADTASVAITNTTNTYIVSSSYATSSLSASWASSSFLAASASYAATASWAVTASYAETASFGNWFTIDVNGRLQFNTLSITPIYLNYSPTKDQLILWSTNGFGPNNDLTQNLGSTGSRWNNIYANRIYTTYPIATSSIATLAESAISCSWASSSLTASRASQTPIILPTYHGTMSLLTHTDTSPNILTAPTIVVNDLGDMWASNFFGTASYARTASFALNSAGGSGLSASYISPLSQSLVVDSGSMEIGVFGLKNLWDGRVDAERTWGIRTADLAAYDFDLKSYNTYISPFLGGKPTGVIKYLGLNNVLAFRGNNAGMYLAQDQTDNTLPSDNDPCSIRIFRATYDKYPYPQKILMGDGYTLMIGGSPEVSTSLSSTSKLLKIDLLVKGNISASTPGVSIISNFSNYDEASYGDIPRIGIGMIPAVSWYDPLVSPNTDIAEPATLQVNGGISASYLQIGSSAATTTDTSVGRPWFLDGHIYCDVIDIRQGFTAPIKTVTTDYVSTLNDYTILADATTGPFTASLVTASLATNRIFNIKKIDATANDILVNVSGSGIIDFSATYNLTGQGTNLQLQCDGNQYWIM